MATDTRKFSVEFAGLCMLASYGPGDAEVLMPDVVETISGNPHHASLIVQDHLALKGPRPDGVVTIPGVRDEFAVYDVAHCEVQFLGAADQKLLLNLRDGRGSSSRRSVKKLPDVGLMSGSKIVTGKGSYVRVPIAVGRISSLDLEPTRAKFMVRFDDNKANGPFEFMQRLDWTMVTTGPIVVKLVRGDGQTREIGIDPAECPRVCCANICASNQLVDPAKTNPDHFLAYYAMLEKPKDRPIIVETGKKPLGGPSGNVPFDPPHCDPATVLDAARG